jgi:hypothetical protein
MNFNMDSQTYGSVRFTRSVPTTSAKWLLPGSQPYSAKGSFGTILIQQVNIGTARLFYTVCQIKKDLALDFKIDQPVWLTHIALKNENRFDITGHPNIYLKQGQFNMIRSAAVDGTFYMEAGNEYRTFSIYYPAEQLRKLLPFFPFLNTFVNQETDTGTSALLFKNHQWINSPIIDITEHLLHCHYRGSLRHLFFDYKIKELLFLLLGQEFNGTIAGNGFDNRIVEAISEARYIMEKGYDEPVTLNKIARQVGMSEVKLKSGLKLLFGI